jgi:hypothetical protein
MRTNVLASTLYRTIADVAAYLEANASPEQWGFEDGGTSLEICSELLHQCRQDETWTQLEERYESVGACVYSPDDNEWEVA